MNVTAQKFQSLYALVCKPLARWNHRTTLPQSRPCGRASSLREGAGERSYSTGYSLKSGVSGDFHRPYEGRFPFNRVLAEIRGWRAIFIAPTKERYRDMRGF